MQRDSRSKFIIQVVGTLLASATASAVYAQSRPSLGDVGWPTIPGKPRVPPPCLDIAAPAATGSASAKRLASPPSSTLKPHAAFSKGGKNTPPDPTPQLPVYPAATSVWTHSPQDVYSYCIQAGVINEGGALSAPATLTLQDVRQIGDVDYINAYAAIGQPVPSSHTPAPTQQHTFAAPLAAGQTLVPTKWCLTAADWKKRPRLLLTVTAPATSDGQPAVANSCAIAPGHKVSKAGEFNEALKSKVTKGTWPVPVRPRDLGTPVQVLPAQKVDLLKTPAPK